MIHASHHIASPSGKLQKTKAAYSGLPFGASFSLLASRAHIPIDKYLKYSQECD
jgi:hypothetical protein